MQSRTILIVDDLSANRKILKNMLFKDYTVLEAAGGEEALRLLRRDPAAVSAVLLDISMPGLDGYGVLIQLRADPVLAKTPVIMITGTEDEDARVKALALGANDFVMKPYRSDILKHCLRNNIALREAAATADSLRRDRLTGLMSREAFLSAVQERVAQQPPGHFVLACFDVDKFKIINDQYGTEKGDQVLIHIARVFQAGFQAQNGLVSRIAADVFAVLYPASFRGSPALAILREHASRAEGLASPLVFRIGRYLIDDLSLSPSAMYDRASLAAASVKGRYDVRIATYNESLREQLLREQEIVMEMSAALESGQFEPWYQPQYNHATGALIGAEALVRWRHPEKGMIPPASFIHIFEQNGFIYALDRHIWESVCRFLRRCLDAGRSPLPVSVNVSRYDVLQPDFLAAVTGLVRQYGLPPSLLRLEITESAFAEATSDMVRVVRRLVDDGFTLEIDDFGSGYSSLNTLKSVPAQVLKLDMRFFEENDDAQRSGSIVESVVRMSKWLGMSVIAEGVEVPEQADYLKSIGCSYIQGYLYARPMPEADYLRLCQAAEKEEKLLTLETVETLNNAAFWDPKSMDTLIFNSYVGGACICEYHGGRLEIIRVNDKYARTVGGEKCTSEYALSLDWRQHMDGAATAAGEAALLKAIASGDDVSFEAVYTGLPGGQRTWLRTTYRLLAHTNDRYLLYSTVENLSAQRLAEQKERAVAEQLQAIMADAGSGITAAVLRGQAVELLFANDRFFELHGYTRAQYEATVSDHYALIHPEDRGWVREATMAAYAARTPAALEYRLLWRDGTIRWIRVGLTSTRFTGVAENVHLCIFTDITEAKQAEQALRETDAQLRFLNEIAHELLAQPDAALGIESTLRRLLDYFQGSRAYIFECDDRRRMAVNCLLVEAPGTPPRAEVLQEVPYDRLGFWFDSFRAQGYYAVADLDALKGSREQERRLLQSLELRSLFSVPLRRDGRLIGMIGVDDPKRDLDKLDRLAALGDYIAVMLTRRDLNARIQRDNQAMTSLMNDTPGGFARLRMDPDGTVRTVYVNDGLCRLLGMTSQEVMAVYADDAYAGVHPDDLPVVRDAVDRMLADGVARSARYRLRRKDGSDLWLMIFGRMSQDGGSRYLNIYYTDMTGQLQEEEKEKELLDNLPFGAALYELTGHTIRAVHRNRRFWELMERQAADSAGLSVEAAIHPDDRGTARRELAAAIAQGRDIGCDLRVLCGGERYRSFHVVGRIVPREPGRYGVYASYIPIAEEEMSFRESLPIVLNAIMEATTDLSFAKDRELRYLCASRAFAQMVGAENERNLIGKTDFDIFPADMAEKYRRDDLALMREGKPIIDMVEPIPSSDGAPRFAMTSKHALRDTAGTVVGLYGVGRDITHSLASDSQLRFLTDNLPGGIAIYAYDGGRLHIRYCNEGFCALFGGSYEGFLRRGTLNPLDWVFEADRPKLISQLRTLAQEGTPIDCVYRVHVLGGGYKWISERAVAAEQKGGPALFHAMLLDVTARQTAQEQLRLGEAEHRLAMLHSGSILCRYSLAERSLTMPEDQAAAFSLPPRVENVPDEPIRLGLIAPDSAAAYTRFFEELHSGAAHCRAVFQQRYLGAWRWLEARSATVYNEAEEPVHAAIAFLDVTERLAKEAIYRRWQQSLADRPLETYTLFRCDLSKDATFDTVEGELLQVRFDPRKLRFNDRTAEYVEQCVYHEDKARYAAFLNSDALLAGYYRGRRTAAMDYREALPDGSQRWLRLTVELVEYPNSKDVEAYLMYERLDNPPQQP